MTHPEIVTPHTIETLDQSRELAIKRVRAKRDFSAHLIVYLVINSFLVVIWLLSGAGYFWPGWVLTGWGIGLVLNAWDVYGRKPITEADIEKEMQRALRR